MIDFQRGAKALARVVERHARKPLAYTLQRRSGNNCRTVGDVVVGKTLRRVAHQNLLLEVDAEPLRRVFGGSREGKCSRGNVAAIAGNCERYGAEIRRVSGANQMHRWSALGINPAAVDREERPSSVVLESAARSDARFAH